MLTTMILLSKPLKRGREQSKANGTIVNEPKVANVEKISDSERLSTEEYSEAIEEELKIQTEANDISKDSENNKEPVVNQPFIWKSEEIRFDDFPDKFDDWSEDQGKKCVFQQLQTLSSEISEKDYQTIKWLLAKVKA